MAIPIDKLKEFAEEVGVSRIVVLASDAEKMYVATWGDTVHNSDLAAETGNMIKQRFGWPMDTIVESEKVKTLLSRIEFLESELAKCSK